MLNVRHYIDKVLETYGTGPFYEEAKRAKEFFYDRIGHSPEGTELFEQQLNAFTDWYLFDRPMEKAELCPMRLFALEKAPSLDATEQSIYQDLSKSILSLYEVLKVKEDSVAVKNLFDGEKYVIDENEINKGFNKGDVFQGRLIPFRGNLVFGISFVFHPPEVRPFILKQVKKIRYLDEKQKLALMHKLAEMRHKMNQYRHISYEHIYNEQPLL